MLPNDPTTASQPRRPDCDCPKGWEQWCLVWSCNRKLAQRPAPHVPNLSGLMAECRETSAARNVAEIKARAWV